MFALETGVCCSCVLYIYGVAASALASAACNAPSPVSKRTHLQPFAIEVGRVYIKEGRVLWFSYI